MTESVVEILGIRRKVASLLDVAKLVEQGLPPGTIDKVKSAMELNDQEIYSSLRCQSFDQTNTKPLDQYTVIRRSYDDLQHDVLALERF